MKTEKKLLYYKMREQGKTQKEAAAALCVSERTCRRWEKEARAELEKDTENAKRAYSAKLEQKRSVLEAFSKLEAALLNIDFDSLADSKKLELLLKYGRRLDELESKELKPAADIQLQGLSDEDSQSANIAVLTLQEKIYNKAAAGELSDEEARKKIALLTEIRKSITAADIWE